MGKGRDGNRGRGPDQKQAKRSPLTWVVGVTLAAGCFVLASLGTRHLVSGLFAPPAPPAPQAGSTPVKAAQRLFVSDDKDFQINLPVAPVVSSQQQDSPTGPLTVHTVNAKAPGLECAVVYFDLQPRDLEMISLHERFEGAREGMLRQSGGKLVKERDIDYVRHPGKEWVVEVPGAGQAVTRAYAVRKGSRTRFFIISLGGPGLTAEAPQVAEVLASFRVFGLPRHILEWPHEDRFSRRATQLLASRDGTTLVTASPDGRLRTWDVASGTKRADVDARLASSPQALALLADGRTLAAATREQTVELWDLGGVKRQRQILWERPGAAAHAVAAAPTGPFLVLANQNVPHHNRVWDVERSAVARDFQTEERVEALAFAADGKVLATVGGRLLQFWDVAGGTERAAALLDETPAAALPPGLALTPDGGTAIVAHGHTLQVFDTRKILCTARFTHDKNLTALALSPGGTLLACADEGGVVWVWDLPAGKCRARWTLPGEPPAPFTRGAPAVGALAFRPDDTLITAADTSVQFWDIGDFLTAGQDLPNLVPATYPDTTTVHNAYAVEVAALRCTADGAALVSVSGEGYFRRWGLNPFRLVGTGPIVFPGGFDSPAFVAGDVAPAGDRVALGEERRGVLNAVSLLDGKRTSVQYGEFVLPWSAFSPDGTQLAVGTRSELAFLDPGTLRPRPGSGKREFPGQVYTGVFTPDGKQVIVGGLLPHLERVSVPDGKTLGRLFTGQGTGAGELGATLLTALSPDGQTLVSYDEHGPATGRAEAQYALRVWDLGAGKEERHGVFPGRLTAVAVSPDERRIAAGAEDGSLWLWDRATGKNLAVRRLVEPASREQALRRAVFSPDGRHLVVARGGRLHAFPLAELLAGQGQGPFDLKPSAVTPRSRDGQGRVVLQVAAEAATSLEYALFLADNRTLWVMDRDGGLQLWDAATARRVEQRSVELPRGQEWLAATPDRREILLNPLFARPYLLNVATLGQRPGPLRADGVNPSAAAFSPDGQTLAAGYGDGQVIFWKNGTWAETGSWEVKKKASVRQLAYAPEGKRLAADVGGEVLHLWDAVGNKEVATTPAFPRSGNHRYRIRAFCFSPDGRKLAYAAYRGNLRVWDLETRKLELDTAGPSFAVGSAGEHPLGFSPDGRWLITPAESDGKAVLQFWDTATGKKVEVMTVGSHTRASALLFTTDGRYLAVPCETAILLWDTAALFRSLGSP